MTAGRGLLMAAMVSCALACAVVACGDDDTKIPGLDLTEGSEAAKAYFACVNDNGGIKGHPIELLVEEHASDPQQVASPATRLGDSDKVDAFVAGLSWRARRMTASSRRAWRR